MDENNELNMTPENPENEQIEPLSKSDAITGVISDPGETFETMAVTPKKNYWIIPVVITVIIGIITTFFIFKDEQIMSNTMEKEKVKLEKKMEDKVKKGKMTEEQARQSLEMAGRFMDSKSYITQGIGYASTVLIPFLTLFVLAVVYLLALKIFKAEADFTQLLNIIGLATIVNAFGSIVTLILSIFMGEIATLSPALLVGSETAGDVLHGLFVKLDIFTIWFYVIIAAGLSRIFKLNTSKAYILVFGIWVFWLVLTTGFGALMNTL
jgi:hypothetical protein